MISDSPINRLATGFLGYIDVKAMGVNPRSIDPNVQTQLDMRPHYTAAGRKVITSGAIELNGVGAYVALTVPAGKLWLLESVQYQGGSPAVGPPGEEIETGVMIFEAGIPVLSKTLLLDPVTRTSFGSSTTVHLSGGVVWGAMNFLDSLYVCLPGYRLGVWVPRHFNNAAGIFITMIASVVEVDY